ncbi:3167_t:CDS:2, partial [Cetraspora pellucida]
MSYHNMDSNLLITPTFDESLSLIIRSSRLNLFIIFFPFGVLGKFIFEWSDLLVFIFNFLAIISFASLLNFSVDEICKRKGGIIGGLLAVGFGNVVELIISIFALIHGEIEIVQTSLLGSIISNLLLVLGVCIFAGGCFYKDQIFNEVAAQTSSSLMTLSCVSLIIPVAFNSLFIVVTVCIAISSECLVSSIEGTVKSLNISKMFIGIIVIPIVGNAAEHFTAVVAALKNNMNLAISISVGSSMQIALFVIPMLVIFGWIIGQPMNFSFGNFGAISLILKKKEREKLYKENEIPDCVLCKSKHFRCKSKKCEECCNLNKCVSYPCEYCKENNIDCEYSIIKSKDKFEELEKLGLSAYVAQLEYTLKNKPHVQAYCQFKIRLTKSKIKKMLENPTISFPEKMRGDTQSNIYYATKKYNKCKRHDKSSCTCHYFDDENYKCRVCNDKCPVKTKSRLDGLQSLVGPFQYGVFRMLGSNDDDDGSINENIDGNIESNVNEFKDMKNSELARIKNEMMIDDMKRLRKIRDENISYEESFIYGDQEGVEKVDWSLNCLEMNYMISQRKGDQ